MKLPAAARPSLLAAALLVVVAGTLLRHKTSARGGSAATAPTRPTRDPNALLRRYGLTYDLEDATQPAGSGAGAPVGASTHLEGVAVIAPVRSSRADAPMWSLRFEPARADVIVARRRLFADLPAARRAFGAAQVVVECAADGTPRRILEREDDPAIARATLRLLAIEIGHGRRADASWTQEETTPQGTVSAEYHWANDRAELGRERVSYARLFAFGSLPSAQRLRSSAQFRYRDDGALASLVSDESLIVGDTARPSLSRTMHLTLRLTDAVPAEALRDLAAFVPRAVEAPVSGRSLDAQDLAQRVGTLTIDGMVATLLDHRAGGRMPDHNLFFWRATGLLMQEPDAARALVAVFTDAESSRAMRGLVLDLLSRTGTPQAQAVLVELLGTSSAQGEGRAYYLQRLGFVAQPSGDVIAMAARAAEQPATREAAMYVVGSLAHALRGEGRGDEARALDAVLERAAGAPSPSDVRHVLAGLANAHRPENVATIVRLGRSDDPAVRESAARALGATEGPGSVAALWAMLDDPSPEVARLAVRGLASHPLSAEQAAGLVERVRARSISQALYHELVALWRAQSGAHRAFAMACLQAMVEQDISDGPTRAAVYALLDTLRARA